MRRLLHFLLILVLATPLTATAAFQRRACLSADGASSPDLLATLKSQIGAAGSGPDREEL